MDRDVTLVPSEVELPCSDGPSVGCTKPRED